MDIFSSKFITSPVFAQKILNAHRLVNPYVQPVLHVRRPGDDAEQTYTFPDDDPFFSEISNFIDIIEDVEKHDGAILSSYEGDLLKDSFLTSYSQRSVQTQ